jgi:tetratricopeptide (TPR) repeat protein
MTYNLRIPGQFTERELWAIEEVAKLVPSDGVVVEVGSSLGMSSYVWAKNVHPSVTVYCIDVWENDPEYAQQLGEKYQTDYTLENFRSFTEKCPNIVTLPGFSPQDFAEWDKSIDVYCQNIDGPKTIIEEDINFWSQFVKPGGIICGFGYGEEFLDVKNKVDNLSQFYQVEPVIVEQFWCLVTDGNFERLNNVTKVKEIHGYEYELEIPEPPPLLAPGDFLQVSGKLKNISGRDWNIFVDDVEVMKIGIQIYEENKPGRQEFREVIGYDKLIYDAHIEFYFVLDTNQLQQGRIKLVFDLVAEGCYWFQEKGARSKTVEVQILPRTAGNLNKVGNQLKRKGKLAEAIGEYRRAIELNPHFSWSYYNLGDALAKQGNINEAIAEYRRAIAFNSNSALYFHSLGKVLAQKSELKEAANCYENSIKIKPDIYQKYQNLIPNSFRKLTKCKVCNSTSTYFGQTLVLNKYEVDYFQCSSCGFVQTEYPYWLEEAYARPITNSDVGYVRRNTICSKASDKIISELFKKDSSFLDYGGGYGLFVRMMRDLGYKFYWSDIYCQNLFAEEYNAEISDSNFYEMVTSFEVFEHFINPLEEIEKILKFSSNILFSTQLLPHSSAKPGHWHYYAPHEGQHISIYTPKALSIIADYFQLNLYSNSLSLHLITEKELSLPLVEKVFAIFSQHSF